MILISWIWCVKIKKIGVVVDEVNSGGCGDHVDDGFDAGSGSCS